MPVASAQRRGVAKDGGTVSVEVVSGPGLDGDTYGAGEEIRIEVTFDQPVVVTGDPELALGVGGESRRSS